MERKWNDNWNESEMQIEWERWKNNSKWFYRVQANSKRQQFHYDIFVKKFLYLKFLN